MSTSFLDTTILVAVSEDIEPIKSAALKSINTNQPKRVAHYAYRELLAGRIGLLCDLQNHVVGSANLMEVAVGFQRKSFANRTNRAKVTEILERLVNAFNGPSFNPLDAKKEIAEDLALTANKAWRKALLFSSPEEKLQPLACFKIGKLSMDSNGLLSGPDGRFDCNKSEGCTAIKYLYQDRIKLKKMIDALDPSNIDEALANKPETTARRKALKRLYDKGPADFPPSFCRKIGDAYFVQMCPPQGHILTSNKVDFVPLCAALNVDLKTP